MVENLLKKSIFFGKLNSISVNYPFDIQSSLRKNNFIMRLVFFVK